MDASGSCSFPEPSQEEFCAGNTTCINNWGTIQQTWDDVRLLPSALLAVSQQPACTAACAARAVQSRAADPPWLPHHLVPSLICCHLLLFLPAPQLHKDWEDAEETAKKDISSMVFNTFIFCQVRTAAHLALHPSPVRAAAPCMPVDM